MSSWKEEGNVSQSFITEGVLPRSPTFDVITALSTPVELLLFKKKGLPKDVYSLQNILITRELNQHSSRQIIISGLSKCIRFYRLYLLLSSFSSKFGQEVYNIKLVILVDKIKL